MPAVAVQIAVLHIPELAARTVADVRRAAEAVLVIAGAVAAARAGGVVLVEVAVVVAPGVRTADPVAAGAPIGLHGGLVVLREGAVEVGDDVGGVRAADRGQSLVEIGDVR